MVTAGNLEDAEAVQAARSAICRQRPHGDYFRHALPDTLNVGAALVQLHGRYTKTQLKRLLGRSYSTIFRWVKVYKFQYLQVRKGLVLVLGERRSINGHQNVFSSRFYSQIISIVQGAGGSVDQPRHRPLRIRGLASGGEINAYVTPEMKSMLSHDGTTSYTIS